MSAPERPALALDACLHGVSRLGYGCMGLGGDWNAPDHAAADVDRARAAIEAAIEQGINFFDHADIYTGGKAERVFGEVLREQPGLRERLFLQSKGGIRFADDAGNPGRYDFSAAWIERCVEGSLERLGTDYLDVWLLHRPDPLADPDAVASMFERLHKAGSVRYFGVSNMHRHQLELLQSRCPLPLIVNQLELSLGHLGWLEEGVTVNSAAPSPRDFAAGTIDYCRMHGVQLQAWGPLAGGVFSGRAQPPPGSPVEAAVYKRITATSTVVDALAEREAVSREAVVLAWLLRHPAGIQPLVGTTRPERIAACAQATQVTLSREDWYRLYVAARGAPLP